MFLPNRVRVGNQEIPFRALVWQAYMGRVSLSSTGFYKTPKIHWDRASGTGRPFYYYAYGAACSEVMVDTLTGEYRVERVDILHDCGKSLNPAIDIGQIEGGFVQGMGWLTTEELWWDAEGRLRTHAPSTYKIPACGDRPRIFNVHLFENENREDAIFRSKAVGEPPLMLGISVLHAISDAVASVAGHRICPRLDSPATPERVLDAVERLRREAGPVGARGVNERLVPELGRAAGRWRARRAGPGRRGQGLDPARGRSGHAGHRRRAALARSVVAGWNGKASRTPARCCATAGGKRVSSCRLGPAVGQCCGGHVDLWLRRAAEAERAELEMAEAAAEAALPTVLLFGAGHVGRSLAAALAPLPLRLRWIDGRADEFPAAPPAGIEVVVTDRPLAEIEQAPAGSAAFVLTHSHSLDFTLCSAVLERGDFAYLGLIGSRTKRVRFERGFRELGISADRIAAMACPIGGSALRDKRPPVIAALAAAEVLLGLAGARHRSIAASTAQERAA